MSLENINPQVIDFQEIDYQSILRQAQDNICSSYCELFQSQMKEANKNNNDREQTVFEMLYHICSLHLKLDEPNIPFVPMAIFSNQRTADIGDFSKSQLDTFQSIVKEIRNAELRARIADVLWIRKHGNYELAQLTVRSYLESAIILEDLENWSYCFDRIERALQISLQLGKKNIVYKETIIHIENTLDKYDGEDPLFLSARLMELLLSVKEGNATKYSALSEKVASIAGSTPIELRWHKARIYWTIASRWHLLNNDESKSINTQIRAAETYVEEATAALKTPAQSYLVAAHHVQHAIEAYRKIKGTESTRVNLHKKLLEYQNLSVSDFRTHSYSIDISDFVEESTNLVKGKGFIDALYALAFSFSSPKIESLRTRVEEYAKQFGLSYFLSANLKSKEGKTIGRRPSLHGDEYNIGVQTEMFRETQHEQGILAEAVVRSAIIQINKDHYYREKDLLPIVVDNPFIPIGRENIFARAFYYGLTGDFLISTHLLLPQIENSLRHILIHQGKIVSGLNKDHIQDEYTLNKILYDYNDELIEILGEDLLFDLKGLLVERFGSNLRNLVAHGLLETSAFTSRQMIYLWWITLRLCCLPIYSRLHVNTDDVLDEQEIEAVD